MSGDRRHLPHKVREAGRIVSVAAIVAIGARTEGRHEVLGMQVGTSKIEPFWTDFLRTLTRRRRRGVKLVISDAHEGLKAAVRKVISASWPRGRGHSMCHLRVHAPADQRRVVADQQRERSPKIARLMDEAEDDSLAQLSFPKK